MLMKREIYFGGNCGQNLAVTVEDGKLVEMDFDSEEHKNLIGNIYKGRVVNVLSGMQAAFVSCGLKRNCYLSMDENLSECRCYEYSDKKAENASNLDLKVGDEIMVQVTKLPRDCKGAKVTTKISYVGKNIIYMPRDTFIGISRKIEDPEKKAELLDTVNKLRGENEGVIIRTAAAEADKKTLKKELDVYRRIDEDVRRKFVSAKVGDVVWQEEDIFNRSLRDLYNEKNTKVYVADEEHYEIVKSILSLYGEGNEKKIVHYKGARDGLFEYGLIDQIADALNPVVPLESGGNIVIEKTEAMNVIDVNTGKFIGNENLEETVLKTNLEAAKEIARQVRLRNLGGIIVVDFIDMTDLKNREAVSRTLEEELAKDRTKCHVLPMSDFCVVEFTRKRINHDIMGLETQKCPHCEGAGYIFSDSFIAIKLRGKISDLFADGYNAVVIDLNRGLMESILSNRWYTPLLKTKWKGKRVYFVPHKTYPEWKYTLYGDNSGVLSLPDDAQILY